MPQAYSDPDREDDEHALPDLEIFQLTAAEAAETMEDDLEEFMKRHEFRLASMSGRVREQMLDAMVAELAIEGGWFYWYCFPGCLPESQAMGPFASYAEARKAAQDDAAG